MLITSPHNERIKLIRALQTRGKVRREENKIPLEGVRLISDAVQMGIQPYFAIHTSEIEGEAGKQLLTTLQNQGVTCLEVTPEIMAEAADTQSPQGIIAVVPMPDLTLPTELSLVLILDGVADPGNLGTILRTAEAASVDGVLLAPGCVDVYNPKVLRGGMGAHFRIPVARKTWPEITELCGGLAVYLAESHGDADYTSVNWTAPSGLIIGGEAHGAAGQAQALVSERGQMIRIPMGNDAESLNAAIATGVILFEIQRQRRNG